MRGCEPMEYGWKIIGSEAFTGVNVNLPPLFNLKTADALFSHFFQAEYAVRDIVERVAGLGQRQLFTDALDKPDLVIFLQTLDSLGDGGLGDIQLSRRRTQAPAFDGQVEEFELIEIHGIGVLGIGY